jgi:signal transduction histidine kinase
MRSRAVVAAVIAFVLVATASAVFAVRLSAHALDDTAAVQAAEAPEIARIYIAKFGSLAAAAPTIAQHVMRSGLRVVVFDRHSGRWYNAAGAVSGPRSGLHAFGPRGFDAFDAQGAPAPQSGLEPPDEHAALGNPPGTPPGPPTGGFGDGPGPPPGGGAIHRGDRLGFFAVLLAGETAHRVRLSGGEIIVAAEPDAILGMVRTAALALLIVFAFSGTILWLYVRGVRRAALRPLHETTLALQRLAQRDFSPRTIMAGEGGAYDELARAYNAAVEAVASAFAERRAAESEMQRFIADAGHEMRTPLTIVMGYLDIIEGGALADPAIAARITGGMRTEATRMRRLIDKLIILARMETPSDFDARSDIDLVSLVQRVIESLEPLAQRPIDVDGLSFAHVYANEDDLAEALTNIIENAIKYAPQSPVSVRVLKADERILVEVADRGPGMTTDEARNAFERFYRGEKRGEVSGSGLGLAIAKRAVERSRGTIRLESVLGGGTTFTIEIPESPLAVGGPRPPSFARR